MGSIFHLNIRSNHTVGELMGEFVQQLVKCMCVFVFICFKRHM